MERDTGETSASKVELTDDPEPGPTGGDQDSAGSGNNAPSGEKPSGAPEGQASGLVNDVKDLPESNAAQAGSQDQSKVYGAQETKDYSPADNPPDRPTVVSTNDRDMVKTGPESIGAGGIGDPRPNKDVGTADGSDDTARGDPDAPQGTGPGINSRTLSQREANNVQGTVRTSFADGQSRE